jgi:two-component system phosphate regulon sensor histidine kinase PhoR
LYELNEKLLQLADSLIVVLDLEGKVLIWNDEAERISGYSREEVIGDDKIWERLHLNPTFQSKMQTIWQQKPVKDKSFRKIESNIQTKTGEERVMSWSGRPLLDRGGNLTAVIIVGHDGTEWKQNEQQLREYTTQVERLNREKSRLLSTTSHELRTPLTAIRGFADLLIREKGLNAEQMMKVERIHAQAERLDNLLTELLAISRIESGEVSLSAREVDLEAILRKVLQAFTPQMDEKGQSLTWDQKHPQMTAHADPNAVEQILTNLLANAIAYTPSGGEIAITLSDTGEFVRVDIEDDGIGIPLQEQERIFYEFYRTEAARQVKDGGSGLGLSIVKRLVKDLGGSVSVSSPGEEKGSTFSFTLPKAPFVQNKG